MSCNAIGVMRAMVREGRINKVSLGMNEADWTLRILDSLHQGVQQLDEILLAGKWNLMSQDGYGVLTRCTKLKLPVVNAEIFCSGALWGLPFYAHSAISVSVTSRIQQWQELISEYNKNSQTQPLSLQELALRFAMLPSIVKGVCVGMCGIKEVRTNLNLFSIRRSPPECVEIYQLFIKAQRLKLIRHDIDLGLITQPLNSNSSRL